MLVELGTRFIIRTTILNQFYFPLPYVHFGTPLNPFNLQYYHVSDRKMEKFRFIFS